MVRTKHSAIAKSFTAFLLVAGLLVAAAGAVYAASPAVAAGDIDITRRASIEVKSPNDMPQLQSMPVSIDGYCLATYDENGALVATESFASLSENLATYGPDTTASEAEELAAAAESVVNLLSRNPDIETTITGNGVIGDLQPGLYLLLPRATSSASYSYGFMPLLVPVPNYEDGVLVYENVPAVLKASQEENFGSLEIVKSLTNMNASLGNPTFVFRIVATDPSGATIYNDVTTISFTEAGQKSVVIANKFPLGTTITVTEVYSGASYVATTDTTQTVTVSAENLNAQVTFNNTSNYEPKGGTGIENSFTKGADGWQLVQRTAESEEAA